MPVTLKNRSPLVVPLAIQRRAGLTAADQVEFRAAGGVITITAKPPAADDEYTPQQRRAIDASLAEADEDVEAGRVYGPFATVRELERSLQATAKVVREKSKSKPPRR